MRPRPRPYACSCWSMVATVRNKHVYNLWYRNAYCSLLGWYMEQKRNDGR